jgi:hypothetical protein
MLADAVLRRNIVASKPIDLLSRAEVLARYRQLREISKQHHSAVLQFLSGDAIMSQARRLGLAQGKTLVADSMDDLNLAFDLVIHACYRRYRGLAENEGYLSLRRMGARANIAPWMRS